MHKKKTASNYLDRIGFFDSLAVQFIVCIAIDILFFLDNFLDLSGVPIDVIIDIPQAFAQTIFIELMMGKEKGSKVIQAIAFAEEIIPIPFLDVIPSCTIAFFYKLVVMSR